MIVELELGFQSDIYDTTSKQDDLPPIFRVLLNSLDKIETALNTEPAETIETTYGKIAPFGFCRIQALTIFQNLVGSKFTYAYQQILEKNLFACCLELFFKYQWNNFVHTVVADTFKTVLACNEDDIILQVCTT